MSTPDDDDFDPTLDPITGEPYQHSTIFEEDNDGD